MDRGCETHRFGFQSLDFFSRHDSHLGPGHLGRQKLTIVGEILVHLHPGIPIGHELAQAGMFPGQLLATSRIAKGIWGTEQRFHLVESTAELLDERQEIHGG
jgi:hypothetical protein